MLQMWMQIIRDSSKLGRRITHSKNRASHALIQKEIGWDGEPGPGHCDPLTLRPPLVDHLLVHSEYLIYDDTELHSLAHAL